MFKLNTPLTIDTFFSSLFTILRISLRVNLRSLHALCWWRWYYSQIRVTTEVFPLAHSLYANTLWKVSRGEKCDDVLCDAPSIWWIIWLCPVKYSIYFCRDQPLYGPGNARSNYCTGCPDYPRCLQEYYNRYLYPILFRPREITFIQLDKGLKRIKVHALTFDITSLPRRSPEFPGSLQQSSQHRERWCICWCHTGSGKEAVAPQKVFWPTSLILKGIKATDICCAKPLVVKSPDITRKTIIERGIKQSNPAYRRSARNDMTYSLN